MKTLVIVRHAKSSWSRAELADHERPLNSRGLSDAPMMGLRLKERGVQPDLIIASTAHRATQTAALLARALGYDEHAIESEAMLYAASPAAWLECIGTLSADYGTIIVVGHNPEVTELANTLAPIDVDDLPTCAMLELAYDISEWSAISVREPQSWHFDFPKRQNP